MARRNDGVRSLLVWGSTHTPSTHVGKHLYTRHSGGGALIHQALRWGSTHTPGTPVGERLYYRHSGGGAVNCCHLPLTIPITEG